MKPVPSCLWCSCLSLESLIIFLGNLTNCHLSLWWALRCMNSFISLAKHHQNPKQRWKWQNKFWLLGGGMAFLSVGSSLQRRAADAAALREAASVTQDCFYFNSLAGRHLRLMELIVFPIRRVMRVLVWWNFLWSLKWSLLTNVGWFRGWSKQEAIV